MEFKEFVALCVENEDLLDMAIQLRFPESEKGSLLDSTGMKLLERYEQTGSVDDLDRAIQRTEQAVDVAPNVPQRAFYLHNFGVALQSGFERTGSLENLNRAITAHEEAISMSGNEPNHSMYLGSLGIALWCRFTKLGTSEDLDRAIKTYEKTLESTSDGPTRAMYLTNLGTALKSRFERKGSIDDLSQAIATNEKAIELIPNNHLDFAICLNNLAVALRLQFDRLSLSEAIDRAIVMSEQVVQLTPVNHPKCPIYLNNLGIALESKFRKTGSVDDLDQAIIIHEKAMGLMPEDHPTYVAILNNLGNALQKRSERTGSMEDLKRSIVTKELTVKNTPNDHPSYAMYLNSLGIGLQRRFQRSGSMQDLNRAIRVNERCLQLTPLEHPARARYLGNLGTALQVRAGTTGSIEDLDRAIAINELAVKLMPDGDPDYRETLNGLGITLQLRFEMIGSTEALDRAIAIKQRVIKLPPDDHPHRAMYFGNLGIALLSRFKRLKNMEDLQSAVLANEEAGKSMPLDHPGLALYLSNLATTLLSRFESTGSMDDLNRSILLNEKAAGSQLAPNEHSKYLNNLGASLQTRFKKLGSIKDLNGAITKIEEAVQSMAAEHPDRAICLTNLGIALQDRFETTTSTEDLEQAIVMWEEALNSGTGRPFSRLRASLLCSNLLIDRNDYIRAKPILQAAVRILPAISPRSLKRGDQQHLISQFSNITARAVSLSIEFRDDPYESLQLLELGRGILANLQLEARSDISILEATHPELARRFRNLRDKIDSPSGGASGDSLITSDPGLSETILGGSSLVKDFDDLLLHIRSLTGFARFLQGPSNSELQSLAEEGPIVVFNTSDIRSDAFLITTGGVRTIDLPLLTSDLLKDHANRLIKAIKDQQFPSRYNHARLEVKTILEWLWDVAVEPILNQLQFTSTTYSRVWPRVWWIGSGLLNIFPIHASGYHDSTPRQCALDRVISSYASTIKSLSYARERLLKSQHRSKERAIIIAMPDTPAQSPLPDVTKEVNEIEPLLTEASIDTQVKRNPKRKEILPELPKCSIVHFTCHGYSARDPSQSSLLLEDWQTEPLTVSDLASLNIESAKFAYLSACHTSVTQDTTLLDESINLTSAIQLSGYPVAIGSLWQVTANHSVDVAKEVYKWTIDGNDFHVRRTAEGLQKAMRNLREKTRILSRSNPLIWAPYIHVGI